MIDWAALPLTDVPIDRLVWPCHDIDPRHVHTHDARPLTSGPINIEQLIDGSYFIHDGRHRAIRAQLAEQATIRARIYNADGGNL